MNFIEKTKLFLKKHRALLLVAFFYAAAAFFVCFPFLKDMQSSMLNRDNLFTSWTIGWNVHSFLNDPLNIFNANIFYPHENVLAYSEGLFVPSLLALPILVISKNLVFTYNSLIFLSYVFAASGAYLLAKYYTKNNYASFIAGIIFGFSAYRIISLGHFQNLMIFWMPFAVLFLQKYLDTFKKKYLIYASLLFTAQVLSSWYNGVFLAFLMIYILIANFRTVKKYFCLFLKNSIIPVILMIIFILPFAYPYLKFNRENNAYYKISEVASYSADLGGYLLPSPLQKEGQWIQDIGIAKKRWLENINFLGFFPIALLVFYIFILRGRTKGRNALIFAWGIPVFAILSFGPYLRFISGLGNIPLPYLLIYNFFPFLRFIRVPSRISIIVLLCLSILVAHIISSIKIRNKYPRLLLAVVIPVFILFESYITTIKNDVIKREVCAPIYQAVQTDQSVKAIVELPLRDNPFETSEYIFNSTCHYKPIFNGYSGFYPPDYQENGEIIKKFPQGESVERLKKLGITHVLIHADSVGDKIIFENSVEKNNRIEIAKKVGSDYLIKVK